MNNMNDMNILESNEMMVNGIAARQDVKLRFPVGRYLRTGDIFIIFVSQGVMQIEIDFNTYELKERSVLSIVPKSTIRCIAQSDDFRCSFFSFDREFAIDAIPRPEPAYMDFIRRYPLGVLPEERTKIIHAGIGNVAYFLYENEGKHRSLIARNIIQGILLEIYDVVKAKFLENKKKVIDRQNELFMRFIHLVYEFGDKEREVAFYADKLCITTRYLASILRNIAHETPKEVIDRHCVQEIKTRLRTTNDSLQSIALQLNFPDQSFFTRYFKKYTGLTPKEFRAKED